MKRVYFQKYHALGNNFIIIDELEKSILPERMRSYFSAYYCNPYYGIGGDDVLYLQKPSRNTLEVILKVRPYRWRKSSSPFDLVEETPDLDAVLRIFEPDGSEASMCGNGIRCAADYLHKKLSKRNLKLVAEIPEEEPVPYLCVKVREEYRVKMGKFDPKKLKRYIITQADERPQMIAGLIQEWNLKKLLQKEIPSFLEGIDNVFIAYAREPHLVIFCNENLKFEDLGKFGCRSLVHQIGDFINFADSTRTKKLSRTPFGLNVNFVSIVDDHTIKYRVYERGLFRETLACGTGAVACAGVAMITKKVKSTRTTVTPKDGTFKYKVKKPRELEYEEVVREFGSLSVEVVDDVFYLEGPVQRVFDGCLDWKEVTTNLHFRTANDVKDS